MPPSPLRRCATPGCTAKVVDGRCDLHQRLANPKSTRWDHLYGKDWPKIRFEYLLRNPICAICGRLAKVPDHYPIGIRQLRRMRHPNPNSDDNMRPLCLSCHGRESVRRETGGWARHQ